MKKVLVVFGFGPGVSTAMAEKFGAEGFVVALVSRNRERLDAGVAALKTRHIEAAGFTADAAKPAEIRRALDEVRAHFGAVTVIEWTAYGLDAGDLLAAKPEEIRAAFDLPVIGLTTAVQAALPDLKAGGEGAVLITNGGLGLSDAAQDEMAVQWNLMGLAIANAAKHKLAALLAARLKPEGIFVGEVMILNVVRGTAFDQGQGVIEAASVAAAFWKLYTARDRHATTIG